MCWSTVSDPSKVPASPILSSLSLTFRSLAPSSDHGVSLGNPNINDCEQDAEGISTQMYSDTFERWAEAYRINTASYFFTSFAFLPLLAAANKVGNAPEAGNILNISVSLAWEDHNRFVILIYVRHRVVHVWNHKDIATWTILLQR
jgi:hypothetical protein